ncbi:MAG TPA: prolyl oligopeptidase family serine peptidase [Gemmataceae bacterium]|nr:prolyl oligopeptidase family serine peptidase [Gemmataceae bacterium]
MRQALIVLACGGLLLLAAFTSQAGDSPLKYPKTKRVNQVDEYHGAKVADPYRWLEADVRESKEVAAWVEAENKVTNAYLDAIPERDLIKKRLTELWNFERFSLPSRKSGLFFFQRNDGLQNQSVLYVSDSLKAKPRVLLDPNKWSKDGTVSLTGTAVSPEAKYLAYGKSEGGSDWHTWHILDVGTGKELSDKISWVKFSNIAWTKDAKGFFYTRYPEPEKGAKYQGLAFNASLYYHRVGTPQSDDVLVYKRPDQKEWGFSGQVSDDGRYLVVSAWKGTDHRNPVFYRDLQEKSTDLVNLIEGFDNKYDFVGNDGPVFFFVTDLEAPMGRLIAIDTRKPARKEWKEIIPTSKNALQGVNLVGNQFIASYLKDARSETRIFDLKGKLVREVALPGIGTTTGFGGERDDTETFYSYSSFAVPPSIYRYDLTTGKSELWKAPKVGFSPDDYETRQIFYASKDGTKIPMFITAKKGIKLDGSNPTLLYGYGGFNISITPGFKISAVDWMEMGGIYAVANIRGGGEYGQDWHKSAIKLNRPKCYEDFIAAAEWLIGQKYTRPDKLAIQGRSNGGLLVGAVMCKRPDLFGACLPGVGVMDMLRFHKFTAGRYWVDDYGSADDAKEFSVLRSYSPYHNLKKGTKYPATLCVTADHDDRVVPSHTFKFISELQYCQGGSAPVLARIDTKAGHGAGRSTAQVIDEVTDEWAFLVKNLKMTVK